MNPTFLPRLIDPEFFRFAQAHHRAPALEDERKPWTYKGWGLYHVILLQTSNGPSIPQRWGYLLDTFAHGTLPAAAIPPIDFKNCHDPEVREGWNLVQKWVNIVERSGGGWSALTNLLRWIGFSLGVHDQLPEMKESVHEQLYREVNFRPLLVHASDYWGTLITERFGGGPNAFFPTPQVVCNMKAQMVFHDLVQSGDARGARTLDPCVGTGRMLLAASNYTLNLSGMDIDETVLLACRVNCALYVPSALVPIPETIYDATKALEQDFQVAMGRLRSIIDLMCKDRIEAPVIEATPEPEPPILLSAFEPPVNSAKAKQLALF